MKKKIFTKWYIRFNYTLIEIPTGYFQELYMLIKILYEKQEQTGEDISNQLLMFINMQ